MAATISIAASFAALPAAEPIATDIRWFDGAPPVAPADPVRGIPFARGTIAKEQAFVPRMADGADLPRQELTSGLLAGRIVKWIGSSTVAVA